jgi:hypothetical protein
LSVLGLNFSYFISSWKCYFVPIFNSWLNSGIFWSLYWFPYCPLYNVFHSYGDYLNLIAMVTIFWYMSKFRLYDCHWCYIWCHLSLKWIIWFLFIKFLLWCFPYSNCFLFVILEAVLFIPLYFLTVYCLELLFSCFAYADLGRPPQIAWE